MNNPSDENEEIAAATARVLALSTQAETPLNEGEKTHINVIPELITSNLYDLVGNKLRVRLRHVPGTEKSYEVVEVHEILRFDDPDPFPKAVSEEQKSEENFSVDSTMPFSFQVLGLALLEWIQGDCVHTNEKHLNDVIHTLRKEQADEEDINAFADFVKQIWASGV